VRVVPRPRVQDVLRLMRRPAISRLTPALAREVALRDGNIQAIVTGRVDRDGPGYLLMIEILDSQTGATVISRSREVPARTALLGGVRTLAAWARDALGEIDAAPTADSKLPQVTTTSLRALQFYAQAQDALSQDNRRAARVLLESAVREDPEFALAHSWLAVVLGNEPDARVIDPMVKEHEERALALASHTTERERLHIVGTYQSAHAEPEKALATWEALARMDPDNWLVHHYLSALYYRSRRIPEALRELERVAQLRPHDFRIAVYTAQSWVIWAGNPERARTYVERARELWPAQQSSLASEIGRANLPPEHARAAAWVLLFSAYDRWRAGDVRGMMREVQQVLDEDPLPGPADRDALLTIAIALEMSAGRLQDARGLVERMFQARLREFHLAVLADAVDDQSTLRRHLVHVPLEGEQRALRFVRAGLYREAEYVMARSGGGEGYTETARGELALRRGHVADAIEDLQRGVDLASTHTLSERYLGAESLATALERLHRNDQALKVLEAAAAAEPRYTRTGPSAAFWLRALDRLSRTYRDLGRTADADAVDARLRRLLISADSDHPLVIQLAHRSHARVTQPPRLVDRQHPLSPDGALPR
jgi:tetratricopeptide (TPR) repeat protein